MLVAGAITATAPGGAGQKLTQLLQLKIAKGAPLAHGVKTLQERRRHVLWSLQGHLRVGIAAVPDTWHGGPRPWLWVLPLQSQLWTYRPVAAVKKERA